jgi:hypothetical protein
LRAILDREPRSLQAFINELADTSESRGLAHEASVTVSR